MDAEAVMKVCKPRQRPNPATQCFMFATGIECSYPTIEWQGRRVRQDELEKCGHYTHWRDDLQLTVDLGIRYLRYGPPYHRIHLGPERYDWEWYSLIDQVDWDTALRENNGPLTLLGPADEPSSTPR